MSTVQKHRLQRLIEPMQQRARAVIDDNAAVERIVSLAARRVERHRELSAAIAPLRRLTVSYARGTFREVPAADVALALSAQLYLISLSAPGLKDDEWVVRRVTEHLEDALATYARWEESIGSKDVESADAGPERSLASHALPSLTVTTLDRFDTALLTRVDLAPAPTAPPISLHGAALAAMGIDGALKAGKAVQVLGPDHLLRGLDSGALQMVHSTGGNLGVVREVGNKHFAGQLRFGEVGQGATPAQALAAFQAASAITLQYYLARIDRQLGEIQAGVGVLLQTKNDDRYGTIETARSQCQTVERALAATGGIGPQDASMINHASHDLERTYASLAKATADFCDRVEAADLAAMKKDQLAQLLEEGASDFVANLELLLVAAVVRHRMNGVQTHLYAADGEARMAIALDENAQRERTALEHLERCRRAAARLHLQKHIIDERAGFGGLEPELVNYSRAITPTLERLERSQAELPPFVADAPFILEMQLGSDGGLQMQWAELACSPSA